MKLKQEQLKMDTVFVISKNDNKEDLQEAADFETALSTTGFGRFNFLLLLIAIPATAASLLETTTMSYVFPAAQCDLDLSMEHKGTLNAVTYLGMVTSGFVWGFLTDTLGRKKLLVAGFLLDAIFVFCSGFSQSFKMLVTFKFLGGFIINGPFAAMTAYISEFHAAKYRARVVLCLGILYGVSAVSMPLAAWLIFPTGISISLFNGYKLYTWNIYLLICTIPSLMSFIGMCFMPESPKFLMTVGNNKEALAIFQKVYSINTGKATSEYPIKALVDEIETKQEGKHGGHVTANRTKTQAIKEGLQQIKPLFFAPYRCKAVLVCLIQVGVISGLNTLRLWLPQIFLAIDNYSAQHNSSAAFCDMLEMVQPNVVVQNDSTVLCEVDITQDAGYINSIIVASVTIFSYLIATYLINVLGKKTLLVGMLFISSCCAVALYFSSGTVTVVALSSVYIAAASVSSNVMLSAVIDIFPTTLRTLTIATVMLFGRAGALSGNVLFPILLQTGCEYPFGMLAVIFATCAFLSMLLPKTDLKALE